MDVHKEIYELCVAKARHEERLSDLEEYRNRQNGALLRVEEKIDSMIRWTMTTAVMLSGGFILGLIAWLVQGG